MRIFFLFSNISYHLLHLLNFFSRLRVPFKYDHKYHLADGLMFFPIVGFLVNLLSFTIFIFAILLDFSCYLQSVILLSLQIWVTRALHEDGFCDTIDGLSAFAPRNKRLLIMSEPQIGSFAVIGIVLQLSLRIGALMVFTCASEFWLLFFSWCCSGALAKTVIGLTVRQLPPAKDSGLTKSVANIKNNDIFIMLIFYISIVFLSSFVLPIVMVLLSSLLVICFIYFFNRLVANRIGGYSGDTLGCVEQLSQTLFLLIISLSV